MPTKTQKVEKGGFALTSDAMLSRERAEQRGTRLGDPTERMTPLDNRPTSAGIRRLLAEWRRVKKGLRSARGRRIETMIGAGNYAEAKRLMELDMRKAGAMTDEIKKAGASSTRSEVRSPTSTRTEVRSPTSTSTEAYTSGNITVTGGAGDGDTVVHVHLPGEAAENEPSSDEKNKKGMTWREWSAAAGVVKGAPAHYAAFRASEDPKTHRSSLKKAGSMSDKIEKSGGGKALTPAEAKQRHDAAVKRWQGHSKMASGKEVPHSSDPRYEQLARHSAESKEGKERLQHPHSWLASSAQKADEHFPGWSAKDHTGAAQHHDHARAQANKRIEQAQRGGEHGSDEDHQASMSHADAAGSHRRMAMALNHRQTRENRIKNKLDKAGGLSDALPTSTWADGVIKGENSADVAWLDASLRDALRDSFRYSDRNAISRTDEQAAQAASDSLIARSLGYGMDNSGGKRMERLLKAEGETYAYTRALTLVAAVRAECPSEVAPLPGLKNMDGNGSIEGAVKLHVPMN